MAKENVIYLRKMCIVPGCDRPVFKRDGRERNLCHKHRFIVESGQVSGRNFKRDLHNAYRKGYCECCGITAIQAFEIHIAPWMSKRQLREYRIRDKVRLGVQTFHGDHIDGRQIEDAHHPSNLQTLCGACHKGKTQARGEFVPIKHRAAK